LVATAGFSGVARFFSAIMPVEPKMQRPPEGGLRESAEALVRFHSIPGESRLLRDRR